MSDIVVHLRLSQDDKLIECAAGFSKMEMATVLIAGSMTGGRNFGNVSPHDRENLLRRTSQDAADLAEAVFNELAARN